MVEFALVLPILLLIIFGIIAFGHMFFVYFSVVSASREAARWGIATGTSINGQPHYKDCPAIIDAAVRVGAFAGVTPSNVQINYDKGPNDANNFTCPYEPSVYDRIKVTVTVDYTPILPLADLPSFPITATTRRTIMLARNVGETPVASSVQPTTTIKLVPDPDPNATSSKIGSTQKFKIFITASDGSVPTGTVTFTDATTGQNSTCGASFSPPSPAGSAQICSFTFTSIGAHNLVVDFTPTGKYIGPTPLTLVWPVASKMTTTSITSVTPPHQQILGQGVDIVAQVVVKAPDTGQPNGEVILSYGDEIVAQVPVQSNGKANFNQVMLPMPGTYPLTTHYVGNADFGSSVASVDYTIYTQDHPALTLTANPDLADINSGVTFTFTVKGPNIGDPIAAGPATISDDASHSCTKDLDGSGTMKCTWSYTSSGTYSVTASYAGDENYDAETTTLTYQVIQKEAYATQTNISVSPSTGFANQTVTINVEVTSAHGTPTGAVNISGPGGLSCPNPLVLDDQGRATCTHVYTQVNAPSYQWSIIADYSSDSTSFKDSSKTISYNLIPNDTSIIISANPNSHQYHLGNTVTFTIQVNSIQGGTPVGTVSVTGSAGLNCPDLNLSNGKATCSITYMGYGTNQVTATYHSSSSAFNNAGPVSADFFAWPQPTSPPAYCPQPPAGFAIDFSTSKQIRFQVTNPNSGVKQNITKIEAYWPNSAENTKLIQTAFGSTTLSNSEHFPTIATISPSTNEVINKNQSKRFTATFDHDLGSGIYVIVLYFEHSDCSLTVRGTR